ncbi:PatB family C-S lyase [Lachnospiraceae bacterium 54-53]
MKYDFETVRDRMSMGSIKWNNMKQKNPSVPAGTVPFSAADMEFIPPSELVEGLKCHLESMVFGYTEAGDSYYEAVCRWMEQRHQCHIDKEWIVESPGVVPALHQMVNTFTKPEDTVLVLSPGYHPFADAALKNGRGLAESLLVIDGDSYAVDFDDLEKKMSVPEVTLMILCNPHNPVGRVWSKEELEHICRLCRVYDVFLISDEIHGDLILPGHRFTSIASLSQDFQYYCAICTAPSKTFNLAGFQVSNIIIKNEKYRSLLHSTSGYGPLNLMAYKACELAYNECGPWLDELLEVLEENRLVVKEFMNREFPQIHVFDLQGTYLQWMDFGGLGVNPEELEKRLNGAGVILSQGYGFGSGGQGFERMNLACPTWVVKEGLERLGRCLRNMR